MVLDSLGLYMGSLDHAFKVALPSERRLEVKPIKALQGTMRYC